MEKYTIEDLDKNFKLYRTEQGNKVTSFDFEDEEKDENIIHLICKSEYQKYKAVCKKNSTISINVSYFDSISGTYSTLYFFDGKKFNKY